jgi:hypothetical protein
MLAYEAQDPAPVQERPAGQERAVGDGGVGVHHTRGGDVPALPASRRSPVGEVDVLAVEAEAFVEAAELVEHLAAEQQERAEHPVGFDRIGGPVVVEVPLGVQPAAKRRSAHDRPAHRREPAS